MLHKQRNTIKQTQPPHPLAETALGRPYLKGWFVERVGDVEDAAHQWRAHRDAAREIKTLNRQSQSLRQSTHCLADKHSCEPNRINLA